MREHQSRTKPGIRVTAGILAAVFLGGLLPLQAGAVNYICGQEEHVHTDACYEEQEHVSYSCSAQDAIHIHDSFCYDSSGNLTCTLEEAQAHDHSEVCYTKLPDEQKQVCDLEEIPSHAHSESCYIPDGKLSLACPWNMITPRPAMSTSQIPTSIRTGS